MWSMTWKNLRPCVLELFFIIIFAPWSKFVHDKAAQMVDIILSILVNVMITKINVTIKNLLPEIGSLHIRSLLLSLQRQNSFFWSRWSHFIVTDGQCTVHLPADYYETIFWEIGEGLAFIYNVAHSLDCGYALQITALAHCWECHCGQTPSG